MADKYIRMTDDEAAKMLVAISRHDRRTQGDTTALLIRARFSELFSQPSDAKVTDAISGQAYGEMVDRLLTGTEVQVGSTE